MRLQNYLNLACFRFWAYLELNGQNVFGKWLRLQSRLQVFQNISWKLATLNRVKAMDLWSMSTGKEQKTIKSRRFFSFFLSKFCFVYYCFWKSIMVTRHSFKISFLNLAISWRQDIINILFSVWSRKTNKQSRKTTSRTRKMSDFGENVWIDSVSDKDRGKKHFLRRVNLWCPQSTLSTVKEPPDLINDIHEKQPWSYRRRSGKETFYHRRHLFLGSNPQCKNRKDFSVTHSDFTWNQN